MEAGKKVVDVPTHLADFGAALTSADSDQMQSVPRLHGRKYAASYTCNIQKYPNY